MKSARQQSPNLDMPLTPLRLDPVTTPQNTCQHNHFKHQNKLTFINSMSPESKPINIKDILKTDELD